MLLLKYLVQILWHMNRRILLDFLSIRILFVLLKILPHMFLNHNRNNHRSRLIPHLCVPPNRILLIHIHTNPIREFRIRMNRYMIPTIRRGEGPRP